VLTDGHGPHGPDQAGRGVPGVHRGAAGAERAPAHRHPGEGTNNSVINNTLGREPTTPSLINILNLLK